jgi:protein-tyrosine phosphatase
MLEPMERIIALDGGRNFRDLGGYQTSDGRRIRWQRLFRTGVMSYLSDRGLAALQALEIRVVCDFRTAREREREPFRPPAGDIVRQHWEYDSSILNVSALLAGGDLSRQNARSAMLRLYRLLPRHFEKPYAGLFAELAAGRVPLVFGCAAGKDRTGLAAALVLTCLGVTWEQVVADFELTNSAVDLEQVLFQSPTSHIGLADERRELLRAGAEARAPLLAAAPEYLEAAFDQIEQDCGSVPAYLRDRLGVSEEQTRRIREQLLEG